MKSPFKFLNYFEKQDKDDFFGREEETQRLFELVTHYRLSLVYGPSGTGKTSLINCGLGNVFDVTEWLPLYINRRENINASLRDGLENALTTINKPTEANSLPQLVERVSVAYMRPVYLIFDQFEELFINGSDDEKAAFYISLKEINEAGLSCRVIIVMREEYLGSLYTLEKVVPIYYEQRLRVDPILTEDIRQKVIAPSFERFNIHLEDKSLDDKMLTNLGEAKHIIPLPYLQVYLDQLWQHCYKAEGAQIKLSLFSPLTPRKGGPARQFGLRPAEEAEPNDEGYQFVKVKAADVDELGTLGDLFRKFLAKQQLKVQTQLAATYGPDLAPNFTAKVLDGLVTADGTKRNIPIKKENGEFTINLDEDSLTNFGWRKLAVPPLLDCLQQLEKVRLLRIEESFVELAHDSLASVIDGQRSAEQRQLNALKSQIQGSYQLFLEHDASSDYYLSESNAGYYNEKLAELELSQAQNDYVAGSKAHWENFRAAKAKKEKALAEERLARAEEKRKRTQLFLAVAVCLALVAGMSAIWANSMASRGNRLDNILNRTVHELIQDGKAEYNKQNFDSALTHWASAQFLYPRNSEIEHLVNQCLITIEADKLAYDGYWSEAKRLFANLSSESDTLFISFSMMRLNQLRKTEIAWKKMEPLFEKKVDSIIIGPYRILSIPHDFREGQLSYLIFDPMTDKLPKLSGITHIDEMNLSYTDIVDVSSLGSLSHIGSLNLSNTKVEDISFLLNYDSIGDFNASSTKVYDLNSMSRLKKIGDLNIQDTRVNSLLGLSNCIEIDKFSLGKSEVTSLKGLEKIRRLGSIDLSGVDIHSISPLINLRYIDNINLYKTKVRDLSALNNLKELGNLNISSTDIDNIDFLLNLKKVGDLNFSFSNICSLAALANLEEIGVLTLSFLELESIKPISNLKKLEGLDLKYSPITDLSAISKLNYLGYIDISASEINNIDSLLSIGDLGAIYFREGQLDKDDISTLTDKFPNCKLNIIEDPFMLFLDVNISRDYLQEDQLYSIIDLIIEGEGVW